MTLLFVDGFEHQAHNMHGWAIDSGTPGYSASTRFNYGYAARFTSGSHRLKRLFTPSSEIYVGFAIFVDSVSSTTYPVSLLSDNGATTHLQFRRVASTNNFAAYRAGVLLGTSPAVFSDGWHYVEIMATIHDTTGRCVVKIDGQIVIDFTGDTKQAGTSTQFDGILIGAGSTALDTLIDDMYLANSLGTVNNSFLGDQRVVTLVPTGPGDATQLTPIGSSNNWENVEELPASASDYNYGAAAGLRDTYAMSDLPAGAQNVKAIQVFATGLKSDAGNAAFKTVIKSGSSEAFGSVVGLSASLAGIQTVHETDPATNDAWTVTGVNSTLVGVEVA